MEDRLAAEIVRRSLEDIGKAFSERFSVEFLPGGVNPLLHSYIPAFALTEAHNVAVVLDGDAGGYSFEEHLSEIENKTDEGLKESIVTVSGTDIRFEVDGKDGSRDEDQLRECRIKYLKFVRECVLYLPKSTPEEFVWENMTKEIPELEWDEDYKKKFCQLTDYELDKRYDKPSSSDEIFVIQKMCLGSISSQSLGEFRDKLRSCLDKL
ncbi:hypothetical protein [Halospina denitrificans]|uniref:hypothetical protein n=1 Tax=Halospina denitrificans TaxID=332522 RepID=UPI00105F44F1|nr:hypothetical protein [Halospina denitrificans]